MRGILNYFMPATGEKRAMKTPIYFDYSATTPVDERVAAKMAQFLTRDGVFGNPASRSHDFGWRAEEAVEDARRHVADLLAADPREIVLDFRRDRIQQPRPQRRRPASIRKRASTFSPLKPSTRPCWTPSASWSARAFPPPISTPEPSGLVDLDKFRAALRDDTILVSVMWVNNEIGVIQPVADIGNICRERGIVFHVDAAQASGKVPMDVNAAKIDLLSVCAHKVYGPKGIGALYVRRKPRVRLEAQIHGGGHERGMRSGTLPTHQIVGMGEAFRLAKEDFGEENARIRRLREKLLEGVRDMEEIYVNGDLENRVAHNLNISFNFVEGESLIMAIKDVAVSSGSACTSASLEPSYVLRALGRNDELAHSSIRFSIGRFTTEEEVDFLINLLREKIGKLRELSPLWEMHKDGVDLNSVEWTAH